MPTTEELRKQLAEVTARRVEAERLAQKAYEDNKT